MRANPATASPFAAPSEITFAPRLMSTGCVGGTLFTLIVKSCELNAPEPSVARTVMRSCRPAAFEIHAGRAGALTLTTPSRAVDTNTPPGLPAARTNR